MFSWYSAVSEARVNFRGPDVVELLERGGRQRGLPYAIRVDHDNAQRRCEAWHGDYDK